jgi:putative ABC transport system permease protein
VTQAYFDVLGVSPALGRSFLPEDFKSTERHPCILSYGLWQRQYGGHSEVLGHQVMINDSPWTVVGVMPAGFVGMYSRDWGVHSRLIQSGSEPDLWTPFTPEMTRRSRGSRNCDLVARLKPGVTFEQAQTEMNLLARRFGQEYREDKDWGIEVVNLHEAQRGNYRAFLLILMAASSILLVIAVVNSAGILLEQALARRPEMAVRIALGASRGRVFRQFLLEGLSISLLAGLLGLGLALAGCLLLNALLPGIIVGLPVVQIDWVVLTFTLAATVAVGLVFGFAPALPFSRCQPYGSLKGSRGIAWDAGRSCIRGGLVIAQVSLTVVLLVGTGLLLRTFLHLSHVDAGCETRQILTMELNGSPKADAAERIAYFQAVLDRVSILPGVRSAGLVGTVPVSGGTDTQVIRLDPTASPVSAYLQPVSAQYFTTLGIPLADGRFFTEQDDQKSPGVVIINKTLAERLWKGQNPVGRSIVFRQKSLTIVGVVADVRQDGLEKEYRPGIYVPFQQDDTPSMALALRTQGPPMAFVDTVRKSIRSAGAAQPISRVRTMQMVVARNLLEPRLMLSLLAGVAGMAMLLALLGIYGLLSYSVRRSMRSLALRVALGAQKWDVLKGVLREGILLTGAGLSAGLLISLGVTRFLESQLHSVSPTDGATFVSVSVAVFATAVAACAIPARRATRVDPVTALKEE